MLDWNSFNKELQNRVSDPGLRYMLGLMYERQLDMVKQLDMACEVMHALAVTTQGIVGLHDVLDDRLKTLNRYVQGREAGVTFESEPITND